MAVVLYFPPFDTIHLDPTSPPAPSCRSREHFLSPRSALPNQDSRTFFVGPLATIWHPHYKSFDAHGLLLASGSRATFRGGSSACVKDPASPTLVLPIPLPWVAPSEVHVTRNLTTHRLPYTSRVLSSVHPEVLPPRPPTVVREKDPLSYPPRGEGSKHLREAEAEERCKEHEARYECAEK